MNSLLQFHMLLIKKSNQAVWEPKMRYIILTCYSVSYNSSTSIIILDRTAAPCGMPKGESLVSLKAGSTVNVSWHLGYPHRGKSALLR